MGRTGITITGTDGLVGGVVRTNDADNVLLSSQVGENFLEPGCVVGRKVLHA